LSKRKQKQPEVREVCPVTIVIVAILHSWWRKIITSLWLSVHNCNKVYIVYRGVAA